VRLVFMCAGVGTDCLPPSLFYSGINLLNMVDLNRLP
jgi:hypothetical protein